MFTSSQARAWSIAAALASSATMALCALTVQAAPASADPADPQAVVPPLVYQSPFVGVRRLSEGVVGNWQKANELLLNPGVARAALAPSEAKPDPHAGHSHHGQ
ncbi:MAG: hypothetical protein C0487_13405 [Leptothrix sp. (in: Bacteria)]|nr:hypothetical protein [Leptothrix sp. (in: b-proteobacteria)]